MQPSAGFEPRIRSALLANAARTSLPAALLGTLALWLVCTLMPDSSRAEGAEVELSPAEQAWLSEHREIEIGADGAWPPIDFMDDQGRHSGIAADFLRLIGQRLGVRFRVRPGPTFKEMLGKVMSGELKVGSTISIKEDRAEHLLFSDPFFDVRYTIHTRDDMEGIQGISDLYGRTVAVEDGFFLMGKLSEDYPEIRLVKVANTREALEAVSWGKADAYVGNQAAAQWIAQEAQLTNLRSVADSGYPANPQRFAVHKDPAREPLVGILNKALASITTQEIQDIHRRWIGYSASCDGLEQGASLTKEERAWVAEHSTIRVHNETNWRPFNFSQDGSPAGFSIEYMNLVASKVGLNVEYVSGPTWNRFLEICNIRSFRAGHYRTFKSLYG